MSQIAKVVAAFNDSPDLVLVRMKERVEKKVSEPRRQILFATPPR